MFHLPLSSPEGRKDFLKTVHSILREKHRRQLLKTESLPLNQQYVPFGGKRLCALKGARPVINRAGKYQPYGSKCPNSEFVPSYLTQIVWCSAKKKKIIESELFSHMHSCTQKYSTPILK